MMDVITDMIKRHDNHDETTQQVYRLNPFIGRKRGHYDELKTG
jgi:hypothetical protein